MRILSWNIQWGRGADGRVDLARTIEAIRAVGRLDAICLQEVALNWPDLPGMDRPDDAPRRLANAFAEFQAVYAPGVERGDGKGGVQGFGNLILSRAPVGQILRRLLPAPADPSCRSMQRICLELVLDRSAIPLRLMTTHLEYYSAVQRTAQVAALVAGQLSVATAPARVRSPRADALFGLPQLPTAAILCGDLNFSPDAPEYLTMTGAIGGDRVWCDAWSVARPDEAHAATVGLHGAEWPDHPYCCDYFMVTPDLAARVRTMAVVSETPASDHQPVLLDIDLG